MNPLFDWVWSGFCKYRPHRSRDDFGNQLPTGLESTPTLERVEFIQRTPTLASKMVSPFQIPNTVVINY